jgi:hypothetical protein
MGLLGKIFKKVAESAGDSKKSSNTASSAEIGSLNKEIEKDLEQLRKDQKALQKKMKGQRRKLHK